MTQQCAPSEAAVSLQQLQLENSELKKYLAAQKAVITTLERRVGRSLESLGVHLDHLLTTADAHIWEDQLPLVQHEVTGLCDLLSDTMLLQKLEAGKVEVNLEPLELARLLSSVSRHLLDPRSLRAGRLVCEIDSDLPLVVADQELTEAVLTDLLARAMKYSDPSSPVVLGAEASPDRVYLRVTAQRFAPAGNKDFATEIVLCCRRVEVQQGEITCTPHPDGLQTVTIGLPLFQG